jgi:hypothetical protein
LHDSNAAHRHGILLQVESFRAVDGDVLKSNLGDRIRPLRSRHGQLLRGRHAKVAGFDLLGAEGRDPLGFSECQLTFVRAHRPAQTEREKHDQADRRAGALPHGSIRSAAAAARTRFCEVHFYETVHEPHQFGLDVTSSRSAHCKWLRAAQEAAGIVGNGSYRRSAGSDCRSEA